MDESQYRAYQTFLGNTSEQTEKPHPQEFARDENGYNFIPVVTYFREEKRRPPQKYFFSGSAARALLMMNMGIPAPMYHPRDMDMLRFTTREEQEAEFFKPTEEDVWVAKEFMPHDWAHGHGVDFAENPHTYLSTRDFTINELYSDGETIIATDECIADTKEFVLRLTQYEKDAIENGQIPNKMAAKALRMASEIKVRFGEDAQIDPILEYFLETDTITPFWIALQLDKAAETGSAYVAEYMNLLHKYQQIPADVRTPEDLVTFCTDTIPKHRPFVFKNI